MRRSSRASAEASALATSITTAARSAAKSGRLLKDQKSNTSERRARSNKLNRNNAPSMRAAYRRFFVGHVACHPQKLWPAAGEASAAACQRSATSPVSMEMQFPAHGTPNDFLLMQVFRVLSQILYNDQSKLSVGRIFRHAEFRILQCLFVSHVRRHGHRQYMKHMPRQAAGHHCCRPGHVSPPDRIEVKEHSRRTPLLEWTSEFRLGHCGMGG
jgi:hypothetical protein